MFNTELNVIRQGDIVILSRKCPFCGKETCKKMKAKDYDDGILRYNSGWLLQAAFPTADASTRELILTGICDKCFDSI